MFYLLKQNVLLHKQNVSFAPKEHFNFTNKVLYLHKQNVLFEQTKGFICTN